MGWTGAFYTEKSGRAHFDGIVISNAAMAIQKNLRVVSSEMEVLSTKITNYAMDIKNLDTYNLNFSNDFKSNDEPKKDEETLTKAINHPLGQV